MLSICRSHAGHVKRWQGAQMAPRCGAAGDLEAAEQSRRVNGHLHLPALRAALEREVAADSVREGCYKEDVAYSGPPSEVLRDSVALCGGDGQRLPWASLQGRLTLMVQGKGTT
jgi:hypothetical protein